MEAPTNNSLLRLLVPAPSTHLVWQSFDDGPGKRIELARSVAAAPAANKGWIEALQAEGAGVCVQINDGPKRGQKHIERVRLLFLDLDGAPISAVTTAVKQGFPKPHIVIESSPGRYHVYWRPIHCQLDQFALVQRILAQFFGGDPAMTNLDRVMRVPGSLNFKHNPDGDLVTTRHFAPDAPLVDVADVLKWLANATHTRTAPVRSDPIPTLALSADPLKIDLGAVDPEMEAISEGDRTQKLVRLAGKWVAQYPDLSAKQILEKLKQFELTKLPAGQQPKSDHSYEIEILPGIKRWCAERDALRQKEEQERVSEALAVEKKHGEAARAYNEMIDITPLTIADFSQRFVYVSAESLIYDLSKSPAAKPWKLDAFKVWSSVHKDGETALGLLWLKTARYRKTVHVSTYYPYAPTSNETLRKVSRIIHDPLTRELAYNTYNPPAVHPTAGRVDESLVQPFLGHVYYLCKNDVALTDLLLDWIAGTIQQPFRRIMWAPLIVSIKHGIGKGMLGQFLRQLVGVNNFKQVYQKNLEESAQFNEFLADSKLTVFDEVKARRRTDMYARLQGMITESVMDINRKYGRQGQEIIYTNILFFSNHIDCLAIPPEDRRFLVIINEAEPRAYSYYREFAAWCEDDINVANTMRWLLDRDLSAFGWGERPSYDEDKLRLIEAGHTDIELAFFDSYKQKEGPFLADCTTVQCVMQYLVDKCDIALEKRDSNLISSLMRRVGRPVGRVQVGKIRTMAWCHRNYYEQWRGAAVDAVREEVKRSMRASGDTSAATEPDTNRKTKIVPIINR
jgi:hypothetical protein